MSEILQPGHHPDADQLSAFIEHALPAHEYQQTLAHLADCPDCRSVVSLSLPPIDESPILQASEVRRSWFGGWNLAWPAAAAACAALAVFFLLRIHPTPAHPPSGGTAAQVAETHAPAPAAVAGRSLSAAEAPPAQDALRARSSGALPVRGRNIAGTTKPRQAAGSPAAVPMSGAASQAAPAIANETVEVQDSNAALALSPVRNDLRLLDQAKSTAMRHPLPSGLPALSMVSAGQRMLVIDTQNTVFFSNDSGDHWKAIASPWEGRAVKVELASSPVPPRPISSLGTIGGTVSRIPAPPTNSSLTGTVKDPAGAVIPGASVVVSSATNVSGPVKTDADGRYVVSNLSPGSYQVEVQAPGFQAQQTPVTLIASQQTSVNFILPVGQAAQSVMVTAAASPANLPLAQEMKTAPPPRLLFEITTDTGQLWTSTDGQIWTIRKIK